MLARGRFAPGSSRGGVAGFSLVELLLAIAIIGVLAGMVVIDYSGLLTYERLKQTGRKLGGYCERARAQAISRQRSCVLDLDFEHSRYRFIPDPARDRFGRFINPDSDDVEVVMSDDDLAEWNASFDWEDLPRDVYFVDVQVGADAKFDVQHRMISVRYGPDGTVDPFIIHLKTAAGDLFSVAMNGLDGTADCAPGRAGFPLAEAVNFSNVMGNVAPGSGSSLKDKEKADKNKSAEKKNEKSGSKDKK
jgi:prepilin-type N-terminal cleavage/methylation domain-containing protein